MKGSTFYDRDIVGANVRDRGLHNRLDNHEAVPVLARDDEFLIPPAVEEESTLHRRGLDPVMQRDRGDVASQGLAPTPSRPGGREDPSAADPRRTAPSLFR